MQGKSTGGRIGFANQLRGVAAASVAVSHLIGVFWAMRVIIGNASFTPPQGGPNPPVFALASQPWFNFGPFGVGLFFLISGLVIPISLEKHTRGNFLVARALRIYPTYVAALLIEVAVLYANAHYWGRPFGYTSWTILSNCLLIQDLVGQPSIDLVNWTLCVELRFYLVMALVAGAVLRGNVAVLLGIALAALGVNVAMATGVLGPHLHDPAPLALGISMASLFLVFMLIGVLFNYHLRGRLGTAALALWIAVLGTIFVLCWRESVLVSQFPFVTWNYGYALALFAGLYAVRRWVPDNRVLDALAAISFPFYLVHSMVGYSILKLLMLSWGWGYPAALAVAVVGVVLLAAGLHAVVEMPTMQMGRTLTIKARRPRPKPIPVGVAKH
jgi:peptidoglycan/LPS O-acetylase OafA/YrhL